MVGAQGEHADLAVCGHPDCAFDLDAGALPADGALVGLGHGDFHFLETCVEGGVEP